jgi:hypothetical protein
MRSLTHGRIFENQHLLDATEIFRKLNVHKKVRRSTRRGSGQIQFLLNPVVLVLLIYNRNLLSSSDFTSSCSSSICTA